MSSLEDLLLSFNFVSVAPNFCILLSLFFHSHRSQCVQHLLSVCSATISVFRSPESLRWHIEMGLRPPWVGCRALCVFFSGATEPILCKFGCSICWLRRQEIVNFMTPIPRGGNVGVKKNVKWDNLRFFVNWPNPYHMSITWVAIWIIPQKNYALNIFVFFFHRGHVHIRGGTKTRSAPASWLLIQRWNKVK